MGAAKAADVDVVLLTALGLEYDAVRAHLTGARTYVDADGTRYEIGQLRGGRCRAALALIGEGNLGAAVLAGRAVEQFAPAAVVVVGVAGGLAAEVALGDVVVATRIHAYHGGRDSPGGFRPRPKGWPTAHGLEQAARDVARTGGWTALLDADAGRPAPRVHFKPIVSGEVVLDSRTSATARLIAEYYSDAVAVDMESAGVAEAAHRKDFHQMLTVRGISDPADGAKRRADALGWQHTAATHAAAFAVAVAERIDARPPGPPRRRLSGPPPPSPFRGLAAFRERDAGVYFGRTDVTDELARTASRCRFVAVVGRSGSGKSSLLQAGLVPRMRERGWAVAALRPLPGIGAATALAGALLPLLQPELTWVEILARRADVAEAIAGGRLAELAGDVLAATGADRLLVCVDQFEEVAARDEPAAGELAELLARLATGAPAAHVILTLRAETLDAAVNRLGLGEVARNSVFLLTAMGTDQLRAAIEGPVGPTGVAFEPGLVERIVQAAHDAPAVLTLLQFALTRLWEEQDGGLLTHAAYDAFGGVEGALAAYAEQVWAEDLDDAERVQARRLLVQLVRPDGGGDVVRRTARRAELGPDLVPIAERLAATRLVVTGADADGEPVYDLAHAALARHWRRLAGWLAEERDFRAWQEDLREGMRRAEPIRGPRLAHALRWLREHPAGIAGTEREFILASRRRHRLRTTAWRGGLAAIVVLFVAASTFAVILRQRTTEVERQLTLNAEQLLLVQARDRARSEPDTAVLMSLAANRIRRHPAAQAQLAGEYLRYRSTSRIFNPDVGEILEVDMSADGRVVATRGIRGTVLSQVDSGRVITRIDDAADVIALSPDGRLLATSNSRGLIKVHGPAGVTVVHEGGRPASGASRLRFDRQGRRLLAVMNQEELRLWDLERSAEIPVPTAARRVREHPHSVWFGPDADRIVVATEGAFVMWHLPTGRATTLSPLTNPGFATVSGDGRTAITCAGFVLTTWDLTTMRERDRRLTPGLGCPDLSGNAIDHAGRTLRVGIAPEGGDAHPRYVVSLMDVVTGALAHAVVPKPDNSLFSDPRRLATTAQGTRLVTSVGPVAVAVDTAAADFKPINNRPDTLQNTVFSKDQRTVATTTSIRSPAPRTRLRLWDTGTGRELAHTDKLRGVQPLRFSADGQRLLAQEGVTHLVVLDVPSLRVTARLPLPVAPDVRPSTAYLNPFNGLCTAGTSTPDTVLVLFAGLVSRVDLRSGTLAGPPLQPWRDRTELARLATTTACSIRPGHDEVAFDVGDRVEVWDLTRGSRVASLDLAGKSRVSDLRYSADGRRLAVLGQDGSLEAWDVDRREQVVSPLKVLAPGLFAKVVDFPTDGRIVVATHLALQVWDLDLRMSTATVDVVRSVGGAVVSADGTLLDIAKPGLIRLPLDPDRWADHLCRMVNRDLTATERGSLPPGSPTGQICPPE